MSQTVASPAPSGALPKGLRGYQVLLARNPNVRTLWFGQVVSYLGDWFNTVAVLGLIVELTQSASSASLSVATGILPSAFAGLFIAGIVADRFNRKAIMIGSDLIRAVIALTYFLVDTPDRVWLAYLATGLLSFTSAFFNPASAAAMPNLATREELPLVGALGQTTFATTIFVGAMLGGAVAQWFGRDVCFVLNSASFLLSAFFIARAKGRFNVEPGRAASGGMGWRILTEGARYVRENPLTRAYVLIKLCWSWVFGGMGLYSIFALQIYGVGDAATSWLYAARGVGAFVMPLVFGTLFSLHQHDKLKIAIRAGMFVSIAGYTIFALSTQAWQGMIGTFLGHAGGALVWTFSNVIVQSSAPDHVRGRVLALDSVIMTSVLATSSLLAGAVATYTNPHIGALSTAVIALVGAVVWLFAARGK
jgi:predicted MFS family arabinose efflux permease